MTVEPPPVDGNAFDRSALQLSTAFPTLGVNSQLLELSRNFGSFEAILKGSLSCMVDDGHRRDETLLDSPEIALHIPPTAWGVQYQYSSVAVLFVLASEECDNDEYVRDYDDFLGERKSRG